MSGFSPYIRDGFFAQNVIAPKMQWDTDSNSVDSVPLTMKMGLGYQANKKLTVAADYGLLWNQQSVYNLGLEYLIWTSTNKINNKIANCFVRGGLNNGNSSMGIGLTYMGLKVDYAYTPNTYSYMDATHRFSLGYEFNK